MNYFLTQLATAGLLLLIANAAVARAEASGTQDATRSPAPGDVTVRVLSYNIRHAEGTDGRIDLDRVAQIITRSQADVVALQEVDRKTRRAHGVDQPAELARLTGLHHLFERNIVFQEGEYGNAILTRWKVRRHRNQHLKSFYDGEQRGVLIAELIAPDASFEFTFYCTHLDYRRDSDERLASADQINRLALDDPQRPAILAGDLNAQPDNEVLDRFRKHWQLANPAPLPTFPVDIPTRQIDYILFRPTGPWHVDEVRVLDEPTASDHRPILATLRWTSQP